MSEVKRFRADLCVQPIEVVSASDYDDLEAECERLRLDNLSKNGSMKAFGEQIAALQRAVKNRDKLKARAETERDAALAELAALKGGQEVVAWVTTARKPGVSEQRALWHGEDGADQWVSHYQGRGCETTKTPLYPAPPAQASAWAEGWRPAPLEPTPAMIDVAVSHALMVSLSSEYNWSAYMRDVWLRMLSAAPTPGASDGKGGDV